MRMTCILKIMSSSVSAAAVIPSFFVVSVLPDEHRYIQGDSFREPELIILNGSKAASV
jgi:hypothetical protein